MRYHLLCASVKGLPALIWQIIGLFFWQIGLSQNCPNLLGINISPTEICHGDILTFTASLDNTINAVVSWTLPDGSMLSGNNMLANITTSQLCATQENIAYEVVCQTSGQVIGSGTIPITIYPLLSPQIGTDGCVISILSPCPEWTVSWNNAGNLFSGTQFFPPEGQSGNVQYTLTVPQTAGGCYMGEGNVFYDCINVCPNFINVVVQGGSFFLCGGDIAHFSILLDQYNYSLIEWYMPNGDTLQGPDVFPLIQSPDPCGGTMYYPFSIICTYNESVVNSGGINVFVYPDLSATAELSPDGCSIILNMSCDENTIGWNDGINSGTGAFYPAETASAGTVLFTISNPVSLAFCGTNIVSVEYNCPPLCPVIEDVLSTDTQLCTGDIFSAQILLDDPLLGKVEWTLPNNTLSEGFAISYQIPTTIECPESASIHYRIYCIDDNSVLEDGDIPLMIYLDPLGELLEEGCSFGIETFCPDTEITWWDGQTNGTGNTYIASANSAGTLQWTLSYEDAPQDCSELVLLQPYDCQADCPEYISANQGGLNYCEGDLLQVSVLLENAQWGNVIWTLSDGSQMIGTDIEFSVSSYSTCMEEQQINYTVICIASGQIVSLGSLHYNVFPDPIYELIQSDCEITVVPLCANIATTYFVEGMGISDAHFMISPGMDAQLLFVLSYNEVTCSQVEFPIQLHCPLPCTYDENDIAFSYLTSFCALSEAYALSSFLSENAASGGQWSSLSNSILIENDSILLSDAADGDYLFIYSLIPPDTDEPYCEAITDTLLLSIENPLDISISTPDPVCNTSTYGSVIDLNSLLQDAYTGTWKRKDNIALPSNLLLDMNDAEPGYYGLLFTPTAGDLCEVPTSEITLEVKECKNLVYIPTAFSPNGDGINDVFKLTGSYMSSYTLHIYDRWGKHLFGGVGFPVWDGSTDDKDAEIAVYVCYGQVTFEDGSVYSYKGNLSLIR